MKIALAPMAGNSALEAWNMDAKTIIAASPIDAQTLNAGLIRRTDGRSSPIPPKNSLIPMKRTNASGTSNTHGIDSAIASID